MNTSRRLTSAVLLLCLSAMGAITLQASQTADQAKSPEGQKKPVDEKAIKDLINQLGDDSFEKREEAGKQLLTVGEPALNLLKQAVKDTKDAEVRQRAGELVRAIASAFVKLVRSYRWPTNAGGDAKTTRLALTPDGKKVVVGNSDGVRMWDIESGKELMAITENTGTVWSLSVSPDGRQALAGSNSGIVRLYDLEAGKKLQEFKGHKNGAWGAVFLPGGKEALTGSWDQTMRVWDLQSGKETRLFAGVRDNIRCLAVSPNGKTVAGGHFTNKGNQHGPGTLRLWDIESGKELRSCEGHAEEIPCVAFSPDGKTVLSCGYDKNMRLWDVETGKELRKIVGSPLHYVEYGAFTPDGKRIVCCGTEGAGTNFSVRTWTIRICDVATGKQLLESEEIRGGVLCVAVLPEGNRCVTASRDGMVRLWEWKK
jgi:WD40 repeat protein